MVGNAVSLSDRWSSWNICGRDGSAICSAAEREYNGETLPDDAQWTQAIEAVTWVDILIADSAVWFSCKIGTNTSPGGQICKQ